MSLGCRIVCALDHAYQWFDSMDEADWFLTIVLSLCWLAVSLAVGLGEHSFWKAIVYPFLGLTVLVAFMVLLYWVCQGAALAWSSLGSFLSRRAAQCRSTQR